MNEALALLLFIGAAWVAIESSIYLDECRKERHAIKE